jgi:hypothetical protein
MVESGAPPNDLMTSPNELLGKKSATPGAVIWTVCGERFAYCKEPHTHIRLNEG